MAPGTCPESNTAAAPLPAARRNHRRRVAWLGRVCCSHVMGYSLPCTVTRCRVTRPPASLSAVTLPHRTRLRWAVLPLSAVRLHPALIVVGSLIDHADH